SPTATTRSTPSMEQSGAAATRFVPVSAVTVVTRAATTASAVRCRICERVSESVGVFGCGRALTCYRCSIYYATPVASSHAPRCPQTTVRRALDSPRAGNHERALQPGQPRLRRKHSRADDRSAGLFGRSRDARQARSERLSPSFGRRPSLYLLGQH